MQQVPGPAFRWNDMDPDWAGSGRTIRRHSDNYNEAALDALNKINFSQDNFDENDMSEQIQRQILTSWDEKVVEKQKFEFRDSDECKIAIVYALWSRIPNLVENIREQIEKTRVMIFRKLNVTDENYTGVLYHFVKNQDSSLYPLPKPNGPEHPSVRSEMKLLRTISRIVDVIC